MSLSVEQVPLVFSFFGPSRSSNLENGVSSNCHVPLGSYLIINAELQQVGASTIHAWSLQRIQ